MPRLLLIAALVCTGLTASSGGAFAQVSPGPLSRAHTDLEGIRNCRSCHGSSEGIDGKCLQCHTAIAWNIEHDRGLHARAGRSECAQCHPEHGGIDFDLIDWGESGPEGFDHAATGWPLTGQHLRVPCANCHDNESFRVRAVTLRRPEGSGNSTWLALDPGCRSCHADVHATRLAAACESCHTTTSFNLVEDFDHGRTGYPLRGQHAKLDCAKCHAQGRFGTTTRETAKRHLAPIAHADCGNCHRDPHQGRFGLTCARCHVESDFRNVTQANFDHDRTRYPIRGAHVQVSCKACHDTAAGGFGPKPAFDRCDRCHSDPHAGTATLAGAPADCAACHAVGGFVPSTFGVPAHANTRFALEGKHGVVKCSACHRPSEPDLARLGRAGVDLRPASRACQDCHDDVHAGQLASSPSAGACESCHQVQGWKPSTFGVARHDDTGFALRGAHAAAPCAVCHATVRPGLRPLDPAVERGRAKFAFRLPERGCEDCHRDVHQGRYVAGGAAAALGPCSSCHAATSFAPSLVGIDEHDAYRFRLEGAHRATPCVFCHENLDGQRRVPAGSHALLADEIPDVVSWNVPSACQECHRPGGTP